MTVEAKMCVADLQWLISYYPKWHEEADPCPVMEEAISLIESMSAELEQVKRERDAAVETMAENPRCETCKHYTPGYFCLGCKRGDKWQWRGVKEE